MLKIEAPEEFERKLQTLDKRKREYVEGLPWPDKIVWHEDGLMIREILEVWNA